MSRIVSALDHVPSAVDFVVETISDATNAGDLQTMRVIALRLTAKGYDATVVMATMVRLATTAAVEANVMAAVSDAKEAA